VAHQVLLYRIRVVLKLRKATLLHAFHAPVVYAVLCEANGRGFKIKPAMPDGMMLDAPEQCRTDLRPGDEYAFGFNLLTGSEREAESRVSALIAGLHSLGEDGLRGSKLGGNFHVLKVQDLISDHVLKNDAKPSPMPVERLLQEVHRLADLKELTLRFTSPLRCQRPDKTRTVGHQYFDRYWCDPVLLTQRLQMRQRQIGFAPTLELFGDDDIRPDCCAVVHNHLAWLDVTYGTPNDQTSLGGCFGRLRLSIQDPMIIPTLVWGQYVGVGANTRFGFGRYRIEEAGPDSSACQRSTGLVSLAFRHPAADNIAARYDIESGRLSEQIRDLHAGSYQPGEPQDVWIDQGQRRRLLSIPPRLDRAMQRCVNELLAPAIDRFLENSSLAYRKGLGRHTAARRIRDAWHQGYQWALKADFSKFFDSVDHRRLKDHLDAYINDDELVELIMKWVIIGAPEPGKGLPTGAVLSPLLANIFLDSFDEYVENQGRRLIRYADDLMLLFKTQEEADQVYREAEEAAQKLSLLLNDDKSSIVHLKEPFQFLGFHFRPEHRWQPVANGQPLRIDDLGWVEASGTRAALPTEIQLPGEQPAAVSSDKSVVILGPGITRLDIVNQCLAYRYASTGQLVQSRSLERVLQIVVLGTPTLSHQFLKAIRRNTITVTMSDQSGRVGLILSGASVDLRPEVLRSQIKAADTPEIRLSVSKELTAAKIHNYAVLSEHAAGAAPDLTTAGSLRTLLQRVHGMTSVEELLGLEGAAAALWYRTFNDRLGNGFRFEKRISPNASDPINVMLNLAQTVLYRQCALLLEREGFSPAIGIQHRERSGHLALASDLQEPFRHVMERAVIEAMRQLSPGDFVKSNRGRYRLVIRPHAAKRLLAIVYRLLALPVIAEDGSEPAEYRLQILRSIRSLRRFLSGAEERFVPFRQQIL